MKTYDFAFSMIVVMAAITGIVDGYIRKSPSGFWNSIGMLCLLILYMMKKYE